MRTLPDGRISADLVDECCQHLLEGEDLTSCLLRYPDDAADLKPILETVARIRELQPVPARNPAVAARSRAQFVTQSRRIAAMPPPTLGARMAAAWARFVDGFDVLRPVPAGLAAFLVVFILAGLLTTGVVAASANALPGDPLYGVKRAAEQVRLGLTFDPIQRSLLLNQLAGRRLDEIRAVVDQHRALARLPMAGTIESIGADAWSISGLRVLIRPDTRVEGDPQVGSYARGEVQAPGDGSLQALWFVVETITPALAPTETNVVQVLSPLNPEPPSATPILPSATPAGALTPRGRPTEQPGDDEDRLRRTPVYVATRTATPDSLVTLTPTPMFGAPTPSPTGQRPAVSGRIVDYVTDINGAFWTIGSAIVETDGHTQFVDGPGVGDLVDARVVVMPEAAFPLATSIRNLHPPIPGQPTATPESVDVTGVVTSMGSTAWRVGGTTVTVGPDTDIDDGIDLGDYATVHGQRLAGGEIHARSIRKVNQDETQFSGTIRQITDAHWVVSSWTVYLDSSTQVEGSPAVGKRASVQAVSIGGRLVARHIKVHEPTPMPPTDTPATSTPTSMPSKQPAPSKDRTPVPPAQSPTIPPKPATSAPAPDPPASSTPEPPRDREQPPTDTPTPRPRHIRTAVPTPGVAQAWPPPAERCSL